MQPVSEVPIINDVFVGDALLEGTGIPTGLITITWPDGTNSTTTVAGDDTWSVTPPSPFVFGEVILANQATPGLLPSINVSTTVQDVSPVPVIDQIIEGDPSVSGTGIAGATITVTWPHGQPDGTTTVGAYGTWIISQPGDLVAGDAVSATQTVPGMTVSSAATQTVVAISPPPDIDAVADGSDSITGTGIAGAEITITWPNGTDSQATVDGIGAWTANATETLNTGEQISAIQEVAGALPSTPTTTTVIGVSELPQINIVYYDDTTISGDGVPNSIIDLIWPDGTTTSQTTVGLNGMWVTTVLAGVLPLVIGQIINVTQTTPGLLKSGEVNRVVSDHPAS